MANDKAVSKNDLYARGWTDAMVQKFLGVADTRPVDPPFESDPRYNFYRSSRVTAAERTPEWKHARDRAKPTRKKAARK